MPYPYGKFPFLSPPYYPPNHLNLIKLFNTFIIHFSNNIEVDSTHKTYNFYFILFFIFIFYERHKSYIYVREI